MAKENQIEWKKIWWTTLIAVIPYTVINQLFSYIEKSIDSGAHTMMKMYFARSQPDYYPLLFMVILFFCIFSLVVVYSMVYLRLPSHWITRGILIGIFLFFVADLPYSVYTGYTTTIPAAVARGTALAGLFGNIVNGGLIAYIHMRVVSREMKRK